jgi:hypothetical protein
MRRPALVLLLLAALALAAGCGSSGDGDGDDQDDQAAPVAAQQVVQEFEETPGLPELEPAAGSDPAWDQLGPGLDLPAADQKRYGTFTIYVVDPEDPEAVTSLLADKDTAEPIEADANGIHWDFDELAQSWVAQKRYGSNVVLAWWNEKAQKGTDERWRRLDRALTDATSG